MRRFQNTSGLTQGLRGVALGVVVAALLAACGGDTKTVTVPAADTTAPIVLASSPAQSSSGVALNAVVAASFSETIDPASVTATSLSVNGVSGTVSVSTDQRSVVFTPDAPLAANTTYTVTLSGVKDSAGNALAADESWSFTTGAAPDNVAPTVSSVSPAAGSAGNPASSVISATFDEPVNCASVTINNVQLLEDGAPVPIQTQCSDATITLLPIQGMPTASLLTASIGPSVTDLAGNALGNSKTWTFGMAPWTRQFGTVWDDGARSVAIDAAGSLIVAGWAGEALDGRKYVGGIDIFVTKYKADGSRLWTRQLGTTSNDIAYGVATDAAGNVFVAGVTNGNLDGQTSAGGRDIVLTKYDANGVKLWTRQIGTTGDDYGSGVAVDASGNVFVAGIVYGSLNGQAYSGAGDLFLAKYDTDGRRLWTRLLGTTGEDFARGVATDASGDVFVAGTTFAGIDGQWYAGGLDSFVTKYDANGNKRWTQQLGTTGDDTVTGVATDGTGNVVISGFTTGALDGQSFGGAFDLFVTKYDTNGNKLWTRLQGSLLTNIAQGIAVDAAGSVFVAGYTNEALDGQTHAGIADLLVTKYDGNGARNWTRQLGTVSSDFANGIAIDGAGNVFVAGETGGGLDGQANAGFTDACIVKYQNDGRKR